MKVIKKPTIWYRLRITQKQLDHIYLLLKFHLSISENEKAIRETEKFQTCLNMKQFLKREQMSLPDKKERMHIIDTWKCPN